MLRLPLATQTLYAELLDRLLAARAMGTGDTPGAIVAKTVRGRTYWYVQRRTLGRTQQLYLGPDDDTTRALISRRRDAWAGAEPERRDRERLSAMLVAGGAAAAMAGELRLLRWLADARVFEAGAVLVGTQAFAAYANVLGVSWPGLSARTADVDLAHGLRVEIGVADRETPLPERLASGHGELRFDPVPPFDRRHPSTSYLLRGTPLRLDLLTPMVGKPRHGPVLVAALGVAAQPLRFLDYVLESAVPAALVGRDGVLVQVPTPARFALHKLVVAAERPVSQQAKARKDVAQASALIEVLAEDRPGDLAIAWEALVTRGPGWSKRARAGLARCDADTALRLRSATG